MKWFVAALTVFVHAATTAGASPGEDAYLAGDYRVAWQLLRPPAQAGDPNAQYLVGVMYDHGQAVARSHVEAEAWYLKAAQQDHALAQFSLGFLYHNGAGEGDGAIAPNPVKAAVWLMRAAANGNATAQALVGDMLYQGRGIARNPVSAAYWTLKAADAGIARARYNAGLMLARGEGVARDLVAAYAWFAVLAEAGYPGAARNRDIVAAQLSEDEFAEAFARARELR